MADPEWLAEVRASTPPADAVEDVDEDFEDFEDVDDEPDDDPRDVF